MGRQVLAVLRDAQQPDVNGSRGTLPTREPSTTTTTVVLQQLFEGLIHGNDALDQLDGQDNRSRTRTTSVDKKNLVYALQRIGQIEDSAALGDQRQLQRAHGRLELAVARSRAASFGLRPPTSPSTPMRISPGVEYSCNETGFPGWAMGRTSIGIRLQHDGL